MSTRAVVTIKDEHDSFSIYTHSDGYPEYQVKRIVDALQFAWPLPRFEAMDFGAAFVAGSKESGGGIYLTTGWDKHGDLEYRYEISAKGSKLLIQVFEIDIDNICTPIWSGDLDAMKRKYGNRFLKAA